MKTRLNKLTINRNIERLFNRAKGQDTKLKPIPSSCQPGKLLDHFKTQFNPVDPSELVETNELRNELPTFIHELQEISRKININEKLHSIAEIEKHIKLLKNKKANNDIDTELIKLCDGPAAYRILHRIALNIMGKLASEDTMEEKRLEKRSFKVPWFKHRFYDKQTDHQHRPRASSPLILSPAHR